jgi:uncharacterized membrane protein YuzA (DUF378 family)
MTIATIVVSVIVGIMGLYLIGKAAYMFQIRRQTKRREKLHGKKKGK